MTAFEIISIFMGILALLIAFGSFVIALLAFLDKRNKRKKMSLPCYLAVQVGLYSHLEVNHFVGGCFLFCIYNIA